MLDYYSMSSEELERFFYNELLKDADDWSSIEWIEHYTQEAIFYSWSDANEFIMDSLSLDSAVDYHSVKGNFLWDCFCSAEKSLLKDMHRRIESEKNCNNKANSKLESF